MSSPGVWLVEHTPNCKSTKFLVKKLMELPNPNELKILAQTKQLEDIIIKSFNECWPPNSKLGSSMAEFARAMAKRLTTAEIKIQNIPKIAKRKTLSIKDLR